MHGLLPLLTPPPCLYRTHPYTPLHTYIRPGCTAGAVTGHLHHHLSGPPARSRGRGRSRRQSPRGPTRVRSCHAPRVRYLLPTWSSAGLVFVRGRLPCRRHRSATRRVAERSELANCDFVKGVSSLISFYVSVARSVRLPRHVHRPHPPRAHHPLGIVGHRAFDASAPLGTMHRMHRTCRASSCIVHSMHPTG